MTLTFVFIMLICRIKMWHAESCECWVWNRPAKHQHLCYKWWNFAYIWRLWSICCSLSDIAPNCTMHRPTITAVERQTMMDGRNYLHHYIYAIHSIYPTGSIMYNFTIVLQTCCLMKLPIMHREFKLHVQRCLSLLFAWTIRVRLHKNNMLEVKFFIVKTIPNHTDPRKRKKTRCILLSDQ